MPARAAAGARALWTDRAIDDTTAMSASAPKSVRLEPMSDADFRDSVQRSVTRHAADYVRRGLWAEAGSLEVSKKEFAELLPQGRETLNRYFATGVDQKTGQRVGETWYLVQPRAGKVRYWIDWIWIDPNHRRKGYAVATLQLLEEEARRRGESFVSGLERCSKSSIRSAGPRARLPRGSLDFTDRRREI